MVNGEQYPALHRQLFHLTHGATFRSQSRAAKLRILAQFCADILSVDRVNIWRISTDQTALVCEITISGNKVSTDSSHRLFRKDLGRYFDTLENQGIVSADDVDSHPITAGYTGKLLKSSDVKSLLDVPIFGVSELRGALCISSVDRSRQWTASEQALMASVSSAISLINLQEEWALGQATLEHVVHHDELTGLPNLKALTQTISSALAVASRELPVTLVWIDLDRFKQVTDALDPADSNNVILAITDRLKGYCRDHHSLAARLSKDEFAVLLSGKSLSPKGREVAIEDLRDRLNSPINTGKRRLHVTASIGVSTEHDSPVNSLLMEAEAAMMEAKAMGGNQIIHFTQSLQDQRSDRISLLEALRLALQTDGLCLHYQPIFDQNGRLAFAEALLRWDHPERGMISPGEFLPIASKAGLMVQLDTYVLNRACADVAKFREAGLNCRVSVNLSGLQLADPEFADDLRQIMTNHNVPGNSLEIEVTEDATKGDTFAIATSLQRIAEMGIRIAIDDFGTGYSSLARLKYLPFHGLKIDRSFISDLPDDKDMCSMVNAILGLAEGLSLTVVAEGVETQAQKDWLAGTECQYLQGFLLSRPLAAHAFQEFLATDEPAKIGVQ